MLLQILICLLSLIAALISLKFIPPRYSIFKIISVIIFLLIFILSISSIVIDYRNDSESEEFNKAIAHDIQLAEAIRRGIPLRYPDEIPKDPLFQGLFQQGRQYEQEGDYAEAINIYKNILNYWTSPASIKVSAYNSIGLCYYDQGEFGQARENFINAENNLGEIEDRKEKQNAQASIFNNLGLLNKALTNFPLAKSYFYKASQVNERIGDQFREANILQNLASLSLSLSKPKEFITYLKKSIQSYQKTLQIHTKEHSPMDYAMTQNNLGVAYGTLAEVKDKTENCQLAIEAFQKALEIRTKEHSPMDYAMTQNNLGAAYGRLAEVKDKTENCQLAIEAFQKALEIRTKEHSPMDYAITQNNLGVAYGTLAEVKDKTENCQLAIEACKKALEIRTKDKFPIQYAITQNNLGVACGILAQVKDKTENIQSAKKAYQEALQIYNKEEYPYVYKLINKNILILGEK